MTLVDAEAGGALHVVTGRTPEQWANVIRVHLGQTVAGIVQVGRDLIEAKADLAHGEWLPMLAQAGIEDSTARRFMAIARHPVLADRGNATILPSGDVTSLYQLSRLPEDRLTAAIEAGQVRPDMPRKDALALVNATPTNGRAGDNGQNDVPAAPPDGTYSTIVADPPWRYGNTSTRGAAEDHYRTMSIEELCDLDVVRERAAPESHLYLWATAGHLPEAFAVMAAWGFTYKTYLVWVKPQMGMGNYFRVSTEIVLFGVRGGLRTNHRGLMNYFEAKRAKHSAKPGAFRDLVKKASPGPYLEMFARCRRDTELACSCSRCEDGWSVWGDQS